MHRSPNSQIPLASPQLLFTPKRPLEYHLSLTRPNTSNHKRSPRNPFRNLIIDGTSPKRSSRPSSIGHTLFVDRSDGTNGQRIPADEMQIKIQNNHSTTPEKNSTTKMNHISHKKLINPVLKKHLRKHKIRWLNEVRRYITQDAAAVKLQVLKYTRFIEFH